MLPRLTDWTDLTDKTDKPRKKWLVVKKRKVLFPVTVIPFFSCHEIWICASSVRSVRSVASVNREERQPHMSFRISLPNSTDAIQKSQYPQIACRHTGFRGTPYTSVKQVRAHLPMPAAAEKRTKKRRSLFGDCGVRVIGKLVYFSSLTAMNSSRRLSRWASSFSP